MSKILYFDTENFPMLAHVWGLYEQNVINVVRPGYEMCFGAKWLDEKKVHCYALPDFPETYALDQRDDSALMKKLWEFLDEADIVIAHNGDKFDIKKVYARFIELGLPPPSPFISIDTLKIAKKYFKFDSNSLKSLAKAFGVQQKRETGGFDLWKNCDEGSLEDRLKWYRKMKYYCAGDIITGEAVYLKMRPFHVTHPHTGISGELSCPNCGSKNVIKRGGRRLASGGVRKQMSCNDCGAWRPYSIAK